MNKEAFLRYFMEEVWKKKKIKTNGMTIYHFYNNKIASHSQMFDRATVMKQLGFV